ncbi:MAG TPA: endonuclease/exonuclease/phosphatase family protein [Dyadobacter sp.]|nr:endonuclease/exonuclease/phosphatase family protein [Dyadobacter sp.]
MKGIARTFSFFYSLFVFYTLICYALIYWSPLRGWFWGFIMMSFPLVIAGHMFILLMSLFSRRKKNVVLPLLVLALGVIFLPRTFQWGNEPSEIDSSKKTLTVVHYNVHGFQHTNKQDKESLNAEKEKMKDWLVNVGADVICMPEYINYKGSGVMDVTAAFEKAGYKNAVYFNSSEYNQPHSYYGMVLFSKYPVVASRDTTFQMQNGMIQADIKVGRDTVRVISVHLFSMTLRLKSLVSQRTSDGFIREARSTARSIKMGFLNHAKEAEALKGWIRASPYPIIVGGDFNETPYSYVYGKIRGVLTSTFEEKGSRFGFSFNEMPYFIRIDHQFYDQKRLKLIDFKTINEVKYSDHYPLMSTYQIIRE